MFICDALHLGAGGGGINCNKSVSCELCSWCHHIMCMVRNLLSIYCAVFTGFVHCTLIGSCAVVNVLGSCGLLGIL